MIKFVLKILVIFALVIFQVAVLTKLSFLGVIPNMVLIVAISLILKGRFYDGFMVAGLGGILLDFLSPLRFGIYTFFFTFILILIYYFCLKISLTPNLLVVFFIFFASFLIINLGLLLVMKVWPSWENLLYSLVEGFWGILVYLIIQNIIKSREEIRIT